ncbi:unnamed protein product, partial [marine sediment metagenome]
VFLDGDYSDFPEEMGIPLMTRPMASSSSRAGIMTAIFKL